jgi:hypothetical protein
LLEYVAELGREFRGLFRFQVPCSSELGPGDGLPERPRGALEWLGGAGVVPSRVMAES